MPIPGTAKLHRLKENLGAANIRFTDDELQDMEVASATIQILGDRYPEQMERSTGL